MDLTEEIGVASYYFKLIAPLNILIKRVENRKDFSLEEKIEQGEWPLPVGNKRTAIKIYEFFKKNQHAEGIEIDTEINPLDKVIEIIMSYLPK